MHNFIVWFVWTVVFSSLAELYHFRASRKFKYNSSRLKEETKIRIVLHSLSLALAANIATHSLPGWIMFLISAVLLFHFFYYRDEKLRLFEQFTWYSNVEDEKEIQQFNQKNKDLKMNQLKGLAVIVAVSLFWGYQDRAKIVEYQEAFKSDVAELQGTAWCNNMEFTEGQYGEQVPLWGWPCIGISKVMNVTFVEKVGIDLACAKVRFFREAGLPGDGKFENNFREEQFCVAAEGYFSFSTYDLKRKMYKSIKKDLEQLNVELCSRYRFVLSTDDYLTLCQYID